jgi:hypothetical protein
MLLEFHGRQSVHPLEGRDRPISDSTQNSAIRPDFTDE